MENNGEQLYIVQTNELEKYADCVYINVDNGQKRILYGKIAIEYQDGEKIAVLSRNDYIKVCKKMEERKCI